MDLILWRHAEAAEASDFGGDLERPLTPHGVKQARAIARWLAKRAPKRLVILVSPALRCQQTARAFSEAFDTDPRLAPGEDVADLLAAAGWLKRGREEAVLVVGHQPTLGRVAALLLSGQEADWSIKKAGLWWLGRRSDDEALANLRAAISLDLV